MEEFTAAGISSETSRGSVCLDSSSGHYVNSGPSVVLLPPTAPFFMPQCYTSLLIYVHT